MAVMLFDFKPDGPLRSLMEKMGRAGWLNSGTALSGEQSHGGADLNVNPAGLAILASINKTDAALGELTAQEAAVLVNLARLVGGKGGDQSGPRFTI